MPIVVDSDAEGAVLLIVTREDVVLGPEACRSVFDYLHANNETEVILSGITVSSSLSMRSLEP